ncbi:PREDICTED: uncharacterized protein LOC107095526 [Cyprinodon variegatus]|uniref:uncharacterized protein LOC107095526 n=1 Tax=Cyprinodon variegatus TaxID=28743 RepID=UPI000742796C|nr:PREDICTED: uncharacterized protein LOC107095526 [Cyprinodon variegatus]
MIRTASVVLLLLAAQIADSQNFNNTGKEFVVVFPENIAYYHPTDPINEIWVTALHSDTRITIEKLNINSQPLRVTETTNFTTGLELKKPDIPENSTSLNVFSISDEAIKVTSTKDVVVQAISLRKNSVQYAPVIPSHKLGTKYFIPPVPGLEESPDDGAVVVNVTERGPFRLIIVNPGEDQANVTIKGGEELSGAIEPGKVAQILLNNNGQYQYVEADRPVAVFFSHPCAFQDNCTCGLLHAMVPAAKDDKEEFLIPPILAEQASILLSDEKSRTSTDSTAPVDSEGTVILHKPSFLLTLMSKKDFGSCFVLTPLRYLIKSFHIVVHKDDKNGIYIGGDPAGYTGWEELKGTDYVSTHVKVTFQKEFMWHNSSVMAVYLVGEKNGRMYGNPAPVVSSIPDYRGCVVTPEVIEILDEEKRWKESIKSCETKSLKLISLSDNRLQKHLCSKISAEGVKEAWIGTRRSSLTGDWYWLDKQQFGDSNWASGKPGDKDQCAVMSLKPNDDCSWKDKNCCDAIRPFCYKPPEFLPM